MSWQASTFLLLVSGRFKVPHYANDEFFLGYIFLLTVWRKAECHNIDFFFFFFFCFWPWLELFSLHICTVSERTGLWEYFLGEYLQPPQDGGK